MDLYGKNKAALAQTIKQKSKELFGFLVLILMSVGGAWQGGTPFMEALIVSLATWFSIFAVMILLRVFKKR